MSRRDDEVAQTVSKAIKTKIPISPDNYEVIEGVVELDKHKQLVVSLKKDVVREVKELSPCKTLLLSGDILLAINKFAVKDQLKKNFADITSSLNKTSKANMSFVRLRHRLRTKVVMPAQYQEQEGFEYEYAMLYNYNHFKLGLVLRPVEGKVYVSGSDVGSISSMGLSVGEALIEVDGTLVTSIEQVESLMTAKLGKIGFVKILVEIPNTDPIRNMIRYELSKNKATEENVPFPMGMLDFAEDGVKLIKQKTEPKKSIFRLKKPEPAVDTTKTVALSALAVVSTVSAISQATSQMSQATSLRPKNVNFNESTTENSVSAEVNTRLLVKCLSTKTIESEEALRR